MIKPLYGTQDFVVWTGRNDKANTWTCECGAIRKGMLIENCSECDVYPAWSYTVSIVKVWKFYLSEKIRIGIMNRLHRMAYSFETKRERQMRLENHY
jgi:hypothetical protein